jgi:protein-disulfide isomerase
MSTSDEEEQRPPKKKKRAKKRRSRPRDVPRQVDAKSLPTWLTLPVAIALVLGLAAGGAGGFFAGQQYRPARAKRPDPGPAYIELAAWSPRKGPPHAKVTIVEFSDFQ